MQQFYHVLAEDRPANASSLHTGSSKGLKWTHSHPVVKSPGSSPLAGISYTIILYFSVHRHLPPVHPLCVLHQPPPSFTQNNKNPKAINRVILLLLYNKEINKQQTSRIHKADIYTGVDAYLHIWCPKCEVVPQQLHDKSAVFVRFFPQCVKLRNSLIKRL